VRGEAAMTELALKFMITSVLAVILVVSALASMHTYIS